MKSRVLPALCLLAWSLSASAVDLRLADGSTLYNVTVPRTEPDGLIVVTEAGIQKVSFSQLDPALRAKYGFDPDKARNFAAQMQAAEVQRATATAVAEAAAAAAKNVEAAGPKATGMLELRNKPVSGESSARDFTKNKPLAGGAPQVQASEGLPWPEEGHQFTLAEIGRFRGAILGHVVFVKVAAMHIEKDEDGSGSRIFMRDGRAGPRPYGSDEYIYFPKEAAQKLRAMETSSRGALSFYVKVDEKRLTAVGRSKAIDSFHNTFTYTW